MKFGPLRPNFPLMKSKNDNAKAYLILIGIISLAMSAGYAGSKLPDYLSQLKLRQEVAEVNMSAMERLGHDLYQNKCAKCHGDRGQGRDGWGIPLTIGPVAKMTTHQVADAIRTGRPSRRGSAADMPAMPNLDNTDVAAIVSYLRTRAP